MSWILGLHLLTAHVSPGYETFTPGAYVRHESGFTAGAYRNSIGRNSAYAGWTLETDDKRFAITAGAVTGYDRKCEAGMCTGHAGKIAPLLIPSMKLGPARLAVVPYKRPAVHLAVEWAL